MMRLLTGTRVLCREKHILFSRSRLISTYKTEKQSILEKYVPPSWAENLNAIPKYKINLINNNTPIEKWNIPGIPEQFSIHIKRDDMTGCAISGNKIRKLEFLLADAVTKGCSHVICYGAVQSNHCRAVAIAARCIGLTPHLILRTDAKDVSQLGCDGNLLLERMCGSQIYLMPLIKPQSMTQMEVFYKFFEPRLNNLSSHIERTTGEKCYNIVLGGSNEVGVFGMVDLFEEMRNQGILENFDDLVVTCASGGLAAGMCLGNYLTGSHLRCHSVSVSHSGDFLLEHLTVMLNDLGLCDVAAESLVDMIHGYRPDLDQDGLEYLLDVALSTGVILDANYTGKSTQAMVKELNNNPARFKGKRILFMHTGGVFGLFDGTMESVLKNTDVKLWYNEDDIPI